MSRVDLSIEPLTAAAFEPFGDVMDMSGASVTINQGTTQRYHDLARLDLLDSGGQPLFNLFRSRPRPRPIEIKLLERHPLSSQAFFPLDKRPWLVVVAPPSESPAVAAIRAFAASGCQGVNYHRGVWHHPVLALDQETDFVVIDRGATDQNCDEFYFTEETGIFIRY